MIRSVCVIMIDMDYDLYLDQRLLTYYAMCEQAGIAPLPEDEAREQAKVLAKLPETAFAVSFRQH
jgi:hypothetical protein